MAILSHPEALVAGKPARHRERGVHVLNGVLLTVAAAALFAAHFVHLSADFPHDSQWNDWAKYTDEGWYGDAAIRHTLLGRWNVPGDFNPGAALPVWPLLEALVFRCTGVSLVAARALAVAVFGVMLAGSYALLQRHEPAADRGRQHFAPVVAALLFCASPFFFVFDRLAILEPLLGALSVLALLAASYLRPFRAEVDGRIETRALWPALSLGLLLPAMVLTKPTAVALMPALLPMAWARGGRRVWPALRLLAVPAALAIALWLGYYVVLVRPHFAEDFAYLFAANAYTGFQMQPLSLVLFQTVSFGHWMGVVLFPMFFALLAILLVARPRFFRQPLVGSLLLWMGGYLLFLAYHNNLQPRYYLLLAVPVTLLTVLALREIRRAAEEKTRWVRRVCAVGTWACVLAIAVPDALQTLDYVRHPDYSYEAAAQAIARLVRADRGRSPLILSVSGSDLTLMTGLPSINDDFGTLDLDERVRLYHPGWYVAWNEIDDDKMDALKPLYQPVRVAEFPAMDDPDRNLLILYRLDPARAPASVRRRANHTPRPLRTRLGQQPTIVQLQH